MICRGENVDWYGSDLFAERLRCHLTAHVRESSSYTLAVGTLVAYDVGDGEEETAEVSLADQTRDEKDHPTASLFLTLFLSCLVELAAGFRHLQRSRSNESCSLSLYPADSQQARERE